MLIIWPPNFCQKKSRSSVAFAVSLISVTGFVTSATFLGSAVISVGSVSSSSLTSRIDFRSAIVLPDLVTRESYSVLGFLLSFWGRSGLVNFV